MTQATQALMLPGTDEAEIPPRRKPGRPRKPETAKRSKAVKVCLTAREFEAIEREAAAARVPVSVLITQRLFSDRVPAIPAA